MQDALRDALKRKSLDFWNPSWHQLEEFGGAWGVEQEVAEVLHSVILAVKPKTVIETGTHRGLSALMIADALRENGSGHLWTVDLIDFGLKDLYAKYNVTDFITTIIGDSTEAIKKLAVDKIDFLWLDADHKTESVLSEFNAALPKLKPGSYIAFHDTVVFKEEDKAIQQIKLAHPTWEYIRLVSARGFDLMRIV